jgi:hemerythrin
MPKITKINVTHGVVWVEVREAELYLCCGCPADVVKHLKKAGLISRVENQDKHYESGPNALLLSDTTIQNGKLANLSEFVILQMLYLQGYIFPGHPNFNRKPILIGYPEQISRQVRYVSVGNHGLETDQEIIDAGFTLEKARKIGATKLHYSGGDLKSMNELIETISLDDQSVEIKNGVFLNRKGVNKFELFYENESVEIDISLPDSVQYNAPYTLQHHVLQPSYFSVTHIGEGNGWDEHRPCMASIVHYNGKNFLIDAGPNILNNLEYLGLGVSEIHGIFLTHNHDDHFAGITDLLNVERKMTLYCTRLVRKTAEKKLNALFNTKLDLLSIAFNCIELQFDEWNNINGMEVMPTYSPHTVETSVFRFRVRNNKEEKTYLHLADTINFAEFEKIIIGAPEIFGEADRQYVRKSYLATVTLKKLDVGGGIIHGHLSDYKDDKSGKFLMAHTTHEVTGPDHRFVNAQFGDTDHLMDIAGFDFFTEITKDYLKNYFRHLSNEDLEHLISFPVVQYHPGEDILNKNNGDFVCLILCGVAGFLNDTGIVQKIDAGNFIGYSKSFFRRSYPPKYFTIGYVSCLRISGVYFENLIDKVSLTENLKARQRIVDILRDSYLVYYSLSGATFFELSENSRHVEIPDDDFSDVHLTENLYILTEGSIKVIYEDKFSVDIYQHQHFGGLNLLQEYRRTQRFVFTTKVRAISIPIENINQVPVLLWRLIELEEMRYQLSVFEAK